jgi:hypothetical protein
MITKREMVSIITRGRESGGLERYTNAIPKEIKDLSLVRGVEFRIPGRGNNASGYEATYLIDKPCQTANRDICQTEVMLDKHRDKSQKQIRSFN